MNFPNSNIVIRDERDTDVVAIQDVTQAAFESMEISSHTEQYIIEALRAANALQISLVAELEAVMMKGIADPGIAQPVWGKADVILAPNTFVF